MVDVEEMETQRDAEQIEPALRHAMDGPELSHRITVYPFGFPVEIRTNEEDVLKQYEELWGRFEKQYDTEPVPVNVRVIESDATECPPAPSYRLMLPYMLAVADQDNYGVVDMERCKVDIVVSTAALRYRLYVQYFLLGMPGCCISTRYSTPVHAGCVALDGKGILLCGDSGAGKSTLSYACARAGWTYVSDDGSFLGGPGDERLVTGDCYKVRFRPSAAELFPELEGLEITPRATGKTSVELITESIGHIRYSQTTTVSYIVFLNRNWEGPAELVPYSKDAARESMRQTFFGPPETRRRQQQVIEGLLDTAVFELRYTSLDSAIERLQRLVLEGR